MPLLLSAAALVTAQTGDDLFRQCRNKELLDSDIPGAIQICERVVRDFASNRALLARTRLQLGHLYETTDPNKARQNYEQAAGMADQPEMAAEARTRLSSLRPADPNRIEIQSPYADDLFAFAISPDGRNIVFQAKADGKVSLWLHRLDSGQATPLPGTENARRPLPFWSPDGRSIGFFANEKLPQWGRGGRELYFLSPDHHLMAVSVTFSLNGREIEFGKPAPLFPAPLRPGSEFEAAPDGERFLINAPTEDAPPIIVLRKWARGK
jgi:hypothetical protein